MIVRIFLLKLFFIALALLGFLYWNWSFSKKNFSIDLGIKKEFNNYTLKSKGNVPEWLDGMLIRNGPVPVSVDGKSPEHWLDGLAMLHAFYFNHGKVTYTNQYIRSDAYKKVINEGSIDYGTFASDPCRSIFKSLLTYFKPSWDFIIHNANVNVARIGEEYVALTEVPLPVRFSAETLDTLGVLNYQDQLPKQKCFESAHPHHDVNNKETINYLVEYGPISYYTIYRLSNKSSKREILARIPVDQPAYMHSFALTQNYLVLVENPFRVNPLHFLSKGKSFISNFVWQPEQGTKFIVIDRKTGEVADNFTAEAFFSFHQSNAYEKENDIIVDLVAFPDASIIVDSSNADYSGKKLNEKQTAPSKLMRYILKKGKPNVEAIPLFEERIEFPRINESYDGQRYQYVYAAGFGEKGLFKIDVESKIAQNWSGSNCVVGEPIFVASPNASKEDEGVILAIVSDENFQASFLLILDARSMKEVARLEIPHKIPKGLHGQYF